MLNSQHYQSSKKMSKKINQAMVRGGNHRQNWTKLMDIQTKTHFRNVLRGDMVSWNDPISLLNDTALTWENLKTKFERDF